MSANVVSLSDWRERGKVKTDTGQVSWVMSTVNMFNYPVEDLLACLSETYVKEVQAMGYALDMSEPGILRLRPTNEDPQPVKIIIED